MATAGNGPEENLLDQIIDTFSGINALPQITNRNLLSFIEKEKKHLKKNEVPKTLEKYLSIISVNLFRIRSTIAKVDNNEQLEILNLGIQSLEDLRNLVHRCLKLYTELFLMEKEFKELNEGVELLQEKIPLFSNNPGSIGRVLRSMSEAILGEMVSPYLFECTCTCESFRDFIKKKTCSVCKIYYIGCICTGGVLFLSNWLLEKIVGWLSDKENNEVKEFSLQLTNSPIRNNLDNLEKMLENRKAALTENYQRSHDVNGISPCQLNIIMRAYRDDKYNFEEKKRKPGLQHKTDEEIRTDVRYGGGTVIKPLKQTFNLSVDESWELIDTIREVISSDVLA